MSDYHTMYWADVASKISALQSKQRRMEVSLVQLNCEIEHLMKQLRATDQLIGYAGIQCNRNYVGLEQDLAVLLREVERLNVTIEDYSMKEADMRSYVKQYNPGCVLDSEQSFDERSRYDANGECSPGEREFESDGESMECDGSEECEHCLCQAFRYCNVSLEREKGGEGQDDDTEQDSEDTEAGGVVISWTAVNN